MSGRGGLAEWLREHQRAAGIGLLSSVFLLFGIAVAIGYTIFTGLSPRTAQLGSSANPSASAVPLGSSAFPSLTSTSSAPSVIDGPSVSPAVFTGFQYVDILRVDVNGLAVRLEPARTSPLVHGFKLAEGSSPAPLGEVRLNPGDFVQVGLGPLIVGDTVWYLVQPGPDANGLYSSGVAWSSSPDSLVTTMGWVAASVGQDAYLALNRRPDPSEYESWFNIPGGPSGLNISGSGDYESDRQVRHDMYGFRWAVALGDQPAPCAFAVRLLPDDGSEPVVAIDISTTGIDQGPMQGPEGILRPPWPGSPGGTTETFTVAIRSGCIWTIGLEPLAHD